MPLYFMALLNFKMKKIFIILVLMFFLIISLVSASMYDTFKLFKDYNCQLIDYGKLDSTELIDEFGLYYEERGCQIIADYYPFENYTRNISGINKLFFEYGIVFASIKPRELFPYILILGEDKEATENIVRKVANFEDNKKLFLKDSLVFKNPEEIYESGFFPCEMNTKINIFSKSEAERFYSECVDNNWLFYPYCEKGKVSAEVVYCENGCFDGKCKLEFDKNSDNKISFSEFLLVLREYLEGNVNLVKLKSVFNFLIS